MPRDRPSFLRQGRPLLVEHHLAAFEGALWQRLDAKNGSQVRSGRGAPVVRPQQRTRGLVLYTAEERGGVRDSYIIRVQKDDLQRTVQSRDDSWPRMALLGDMERIVVQGAVGGYRPQKHTRENHAPLFLTDDGLETRNWDRKQPHLPKLAEYESRNLHREPGQARLRARNRLLCGGSQVRQPPASDAQVRQRRLERGRWKLLRRKEHLDWQITACVQ